MPHNSIRLNIVKKILLWCAESFLSLLIILGAIFAGVNVLVIPGLIAYGFSSHWGVTGVVTVVWWLMLASAIIREVCGPRENR